MEKKLFTFRKRVARQNSSYLVQYCAVIKKIDKNTNLKIKVLTLKRKKFGIRQLGLGNLSGGKTQQPCPLRGGSAQKTKQKPAVNR